MSASFWWRVIARPQRAGGFYHSSRRTSASVPMPLDRSTWLAAADPRPPSVHPSMPSARLLHVPGTDPGILDVGLVFLSGRSNISRPRGWRSLELSRRPGPRANRDGPGYGHLDSLPGGGAPPDSEWDGLRRIKSRGCAAARGLHSGYTACAAKNWCLRLTAIRLSHNSGVTSSIVALIMRGVVDQDGDRPERFADILDRTPERGDIGDVAMLVMQLDFGPISAISFLAASSAMSMKPTLRLARRSAARSICRSRWRRRKRKRLCLSSLDKSRISRAPSRMRIS